MSNPRTLPTLNDGTGRTLLSTDLMISRLGADVADSKVTDAQVATFVRSTSHHAIFITINGANGGVITTGDIGIVFPVTLTGTITGWAIGGDQSGSAVIDVKRSGTSIVGSGNKPTASSAQTATANTSGWTSTAVTLGDFLTFNVNSVTSFTKIVLALEITEG